MKNLFKKALFNITEFIIKFLLKFNFGRFIIDEATKVILSETKKISHDGIFLKFCTPNRISFYRVQTFSTKEPETLNWIDSFKKNENKVFWDIGANIGLYSCYAAKKINCEVYAFEPSVFNLELLTRNINLNSLNDRISVIPFPLSDITAFKKFFITTKTWGGAFSNFGESRNHHGELVSNSFNYNTLGMSIDNTISHLEFKKPNYIKMDVDGIEHLILKGSLNTLSTVESILLEVNENNSNQFNDIKQYLDSAGFRLKEKKQIKVVENSLNVPYFYNQIWIKK